MAKKKKKMTKAQAPAARKEGTPSEALRARSREHGKEVRAQKIEAEQKAKESNGSRTVMIVVVIIVLAAIALGFTFLPGMIMGGR